MIITSNNNEKVREVDPTALMVDHVESKGVLYNVFYKFLMITSV